MDDLTPPPYELSVVVPALNEVDNVGPLAEQFEAAVRHGPGGEPQVAAELIVVDDGSTDGTDVKLRALAAGRPWLVVLRRERPMGQSAAMRAGVAAARGAFVGFLDADLQNDPAELPAMLALLKERDVDLVQGDRSASRQDTAGRRVASVVGRRARGLILKDAVRDTGCSARVMRADLARQLPLQFKGMHRFIPAYAQLVGARVIETPVRHRARTAGVTKYGVGVLTRGAAGLRDCLAVRWMAQRYRDPAAREIKPEGAGGVG